MTEHELHNDGESTHDPLTARIEKLRRHRAIQFSLGVGTVVMLTGLTAGFFFFGADTDVVNGRTWAVAFRALFLLFIATMVILWLTAAYESHVRLKNLEHQREPEDPIP